MKIILLEDVKSVGKKGELVELKDCLLYTSDAADD